MPTRTIQPGDAPEWLRMRSALWPDGTEGEHAAEVEAYFAGRPEGTPPLAAVFVHARTEGGLCGFLELSVRDYAEGCAGAAPYVEGWFVDADARGKGVGRALVAAAEAWARARGFTELASDTELHNHVSERAHRALGFEEVERAIHFRKAI